MTELARSCVNYPTLLNELVIIMYMYYHVSITTFKNMLSLILSQTIIYYGCLYGVNNPTLYVAHHLD